MKSTDLLVVVTLTLPLAACPKDEEGGADENATADMDAEADADVDADADGESGTSSAGETSMDGSTAATEDGPDTTDQSTTDAETTVSDTTDGMTTVDETTDGGTTDGGPLQWWESCGDPVCNGYGGPWPDVPACGADIQEGVPCSMADQTCDFMSDCNAVMVCAAEDPKMQEGGCPISRAEFKQDIAYLDANQRDAFYQQVLDMRMATWRYRQRSDGKQHLGVILEDGEDQVWADPANDRVDLYSYGSLAIVGVQTQAQEIAELKAAVSALQSEVVELREQAERCEKR